MYAKSIGRLLPGSQYCYGQKVVRLRRRTTYFIFTAVAVVAYTPWLLVRAQASQFKAVDYTPLYLTDATSRHSLASPLAIEPISDQLATVLQSWQSAHANHRWAVSISSISGPAFTADLNPSQTFEIASLYKLMLTDQLFKLYQPADLASVQLKVAGRGELSLDRCVQLMLSVSDNPCGEAVGSLLGWSRANAPLRSLGLAGTAINNPAGPTSTAADINAYLKALAAGKLMSAPAQDYVLALMKNQKLRAGIPAGCASCTVADKTGDLGRVRHDAAIVTYGSSSYALTILTDGASYAQIAQLTNQIQEVIGPATKH